MFKNTVARQGKIEEGFETVNSEMKTTVSVNEMLRERTSEHAKKLETLRLGLDFVKETK